MKVCKCPLGGDCGGTGWEYVSAIEYGDPKPADYIPCECNPHAAGMPGWPLEYRLEDGRWVGAGWATACVHTDDLNDEPF